MTGGFHGIVGSSATPYNALGGLPAGHPGGNSVFLSNVPTPRDLSEACQRPRHVDALTLIAYTAAIQPDA